MTPARPPLTTGTTGAELSRWYWLRDELAALARGLGISTSGGKQELTARIVARLDGCPPPPRRRSPAASSLPEPLTPGTRILAGQRCTQQLRRYFLGEIGPAFRFDAPMREHLAAGQGRTLDEAVRHWHASRTRERGEIGPQFELNRFVRRWHGEHPGGSRSEALDAWRTHRGAPLDARET